MVTQQIYVQKVAAQSNSTKLLINKTKSRLLELDLKKRVLDIPNDRFTRIYSIIAWSKRSRTIASEIFNRKIPGFNGPSTRISMADEIAPLY